MSEKKEVQRVKLELGLGGEVPDYHCPRCGKKFLTGEGVDSCPHLCYFFTDMVGEFMYVAKELGEAKYPEHGDEDEEWDPTSIMRNEVVTQSTNSDAIVEFTVSHGGMACGPVFCTDIFCIDYGRGR